MEQKGKYITKSKRITSLEKQVEELQKQIEALTIYLDQSHKMLLRSNPRLAESLKRDWEKINHHRQHRNNQNSGIRVYPYYLVLTPVLTRDSNGRLVASPRPNKA
jgi:predicted  nucleic acid-binding Zn-ribbon protein